MSNFKHYPQANIMEELYQASDFVSLFNLVAKMTHVNKEPLIKDDPSEIRRLNDEPSLQTNPSHIQTHPTNDNLPQQTIPLNESKIKENVDIPYSNLEDSQSKSKGKRPCYNSEPSIIELSEKETSEPTPFEKEFLRKFTKKIRINSSSYPNKHSTQNISKGFKICSKSGYQGKRPLCHRCEKHHSGFCKVMCQKCKKTGHMDKNCRSTASTSKSKPKNTTTIFTCYECGQTGHLRHQCPNKKIEFRTHDDSLKINSNETRLENMERDMEIVKKYIQDIARIAGDPRH